MKPGVRTRKCLRWLFLAVAVLFVGVHVFADDKPSKEVRSPVEVVIPERPHDPRVKPEANKELNKSTAATNSNQASSYSVEDLARMFPAVAKANAAYKKSRDEYLAASERLRKINNHEHVDVSISPWQDKTDAEFEVRRTKAAMDKTNSEAATEVGKALGELNRQERERAEAAARFQQPPPKPQTESKGDRHGIGPRL